MDVGNIRAKLDAALDSSAFERFDERLDKARQKAARKVEAKLDADFDSGAFVAYSKALDAAQAKAKRREAFKAELGADFDESAFREYERALVRTDAHTQRATSNVRGFGGAIGDANQRMQFFSRTMGLLKWPALITGAGGAAQAVSALAGGLVGLGSALAPLSGALAAYPALLGAVGQASGVVALSGISDLTDAVGGLNEKIDKQGEAYKKLSPQAQRFAERLDSLKSPIREIQRDVQRPLFAGLEKGLQRAQGVLEPFRRGITRTSEVMGDLAAKAGRLVGSRGFGRDLERVMTTNAGLMRSLGRAGLNVGNALRHVVVEARPLIKWMGELAVSWSKQIENAAKAGRETGKLGDFFDRTRSTMERLISIGGSLATAFGNIFKAARPLGEDLLGFFDRAARRFAEWTESASGRNSIAEYFRDIRAPLFETFRLVGDLISSFFQLGQTSGLRQLIRQIRTELVPAFTDMIEGTTKSFGPVLIDALTEFGKLLGTMMGTSGPLNVFVKAFTGAARALNSLIDKVPVLGDVIVTTLGALSISKLLGFSAIKGALATNLAAGVDQATTGAPAQTMKSRFATFGKRVLGGALGLGLMGGLSEAFQSKNIPGEGMFYTRLADFAVGVFEMIGIDAGKTSSEIYLEVFKSQVKAQARSFGGTVSDALNSELQPAIEGGVLRHFDTEDLKFTRRDAEEIFSEVWDGADDTQKHMLRGIAGGINAAGKLLAKTSIRLPEDFVRTDPDAAKKFTRQFLDGLDRLKSGMLSRWGDIRDVLRENQRLIENTPGLNGRAAGEAMARNYRESAQALQRAMEKGWIEPTKKNRERIRDLIRKANLADPSRKAAEEFGREWGKGLDESREITREKLDKVIERLEGFRGPAREAAWKGMKEILIAARRSNDLSAEEFRDLRSRILGQVDGLAGDLGNKKGKLRVAFDDLIVGSLQGVLSGVANTMDQIVDQVGNAGRPGGGGGGRPGRDRAAPLPPAAPRAAQARGAKPIGQTPVIAAGGSTQTRPLIQPGPVKVPGSGQPGRAPGRPGKPIRQSQPMGAVAAAISAGHVEEQISEGERLRRELSGIYADLTAFGADQANELASRVGAHMAFLTDTSTREGEDFRRGVGARFRQTRDETTRTAFEIQDRVVDAFARMGDDANRAVEAMRDRIDLKWRDIRTRSRSGAENARSEVEEQIGKLPGKAAEDFRSMEDRIKERLDAMNLGDKAGKAFQPIVDRAAAAKTDAASKIGELKQAVDDALEKLDKLARKARSTPTRPSGGGGGGGKPRSGVVDGPPGPDAIPAWLTKGEFVIREPAVRELGVPFLEHLNAMGFQTGGYVPPSIASLQKQLRQLKKGKDSKKQKALMKVLKARIRGMSSAQGTWPDANTPPGYAMEAASYLVGDSALEALGPGGGAAVGAWEAPSSDPLQALMDAYIGGDAAGHVVSDKWKGAFAGVGGLFDALYSGIAGNNAGAASAAEAAIFGSGGQSILSGAIGLLGNVSSTGAGLISAASQGTGGALDQFISGIYGAYDVRQAGREQLMGASLYGIDRIKLGTAQFTQAEAIALADLRAQLKGVKGGKKGKKERERINAQIAAITKGAGFSIDDQGNIHGLTPEELAIFEGLQSQAMALPGTGAEDLAQVGQAQQGALETAASFRESIAGMLSGFGGTDASRARSDYLSALDAGFEEVRSFQAGRANLMREFGSNFRGARGETAETSARTFGAFGQRPEGGAESSGAAGPVTVNNYFQQPPPDPHIWSRGTLFELRAGV